MIEAIEAFIAKRPKFRENFPHFNVRDALPAPYLFWYYNRSPQAFDGLSDLHRKYLNNLTGWIDSNYGDIYDRADKQLLRGVVSYESMEFLIKPGDVIISNDKPDQEDENLHAEIATSWPSSETPKLVDIGSDMPWAKKIKEDAKRYTWTWNVDSWAYKYDGSFYRDTGFTQIKMEAESVDEEIEIRKLNVYPLKYASEETVQFLEQRGKAYWSCRHRKLVSYDDKNGTYGV
jgi:hypothetical protein